MDKFSEFLSLAQKNPELLSQLGPLLEGLAADKDGDGKADNALFEGVAGLAEKFGIDLTPDDVADAKAQAQAKNEDADDGFGFDDIAGLAGKFLGGNSGSNSNNNDGFGLDDVASMLGGLAGGNDEKADSKTDSGFNPLDMLVSMFK